MCFFFYYPLHIWVHEACLRSVRHVIHDSEFNRKYPRRLQKRTLKNGSRIKHCKQQLFTLTMCLPASLWAQIARTPFHYTITAQTLLAKCDDYRFQRSILQFPALGKKYRIASMFILTRAVSTPRDVERRENGSMLCETIEIISWSSCESIGKHENIVLKSTMTEQWNSLFQQ